MAELDEVKGSLAWFDGRPEELTGTVRRFERVLATERFLDGAIVRAYHGRPMIPAGPQATSASTVLPRASLYVAGLEALTQENLLRSALDTVASQIVREPAVKVISTEGSWSEQINARKLSLLATSFLQSSGFVDLMTPVLVDAMTCMAGFWLWSISASGKLRCERLLPHQVSWNPGEGPSPRTICVRHAVPRRTISQQFLGEVVNDHTVTKSDIDSLPIYRPSPEFFLDHPWSYLPESDLVEVCEAWRTADGEDVGRHAMVSGKLVLVDEKWKLETWPVVPLRWSESYDTFAGVPGARLILAAQMRVNRMNRVVDESQSKMCVSKVFLPKGSEVQNWTNAIGELVYYNADGGVPQVIPGQALAPEYYKEAERVRSSMYEMLGVSQSIATAAKDPGVTSGRAIRERYDIASGRLVLHAGRLERAVERNVEAALLLMAHTKGRGVHGEDEARLAKEIDWSKVLDARNAIQVRAFITSAVPTQPAGRAETLAEWVANGVITQRRATRWYADPDTASIEDEESAIEDYARKCIDSALFDGEYVAPEAAMGSEGLAMLADLANKAILSALTRPVAPPEANLELLRRLAERAQEMATPPQQPAPTAAPGPAAPQGPPGQPAPGPASPPQMVQ